MKPRQLVLRIAGAGAFAVGGLLLAAGPAAAEPAASVTSGWWNEAGTGAVTAPSTASSGQLQVSSGLQGPLAFAAVRITVPANLDPATATATLSLVQVANSAVGTVAVSACPTTSSWSPGGDQASSSAPGYDCSNGRQADAIDSDGQDSFAIPAGWASGSTIDVAIVPTPGTTAPFSVHYTAPTTQSAGLSGPSTPPSASIPSGAGTGSDAPAGSGAPQPTPVGAPPGTAAVTIAPSTAGSATATPGGGTSAPSMSAPPPALASSPVAAMPAPASGPPGGSPSIQPLPARSGTAQSASPISGHPLVGPGRAGRILAISVLLLLGVVMFGLSAYPIGHARQLVPVGAGRSPAPVVPLTSQVGGIGRFAKPRTAPPRRL